MLKSNQKCLVTSQENNSYSFYIFSPIFSTSEELQATLAELADLQSQLADAHADNERLADEKQVLLESLCRQTEKLEDSRTKVRFWSYLLFSVNKEFCP